MTGISDSGKKAPARQDMNDKGRKDNKSTGPQRESQGSGRGSNLTNEDRKKGGGQSHSRK